MPLPPAILPRSAGWKPAVSQLGNLRAPAIKPKLGLALGLAGPNTRTRTAGLLFIGAARPRRVITQRPSWKRNPGNQIAAQRSAASVLAMTDSERQAILEVCFHAALADGQKSANEQAALQRVAERLQVQLPFHLNTAADLYARSQAVEVVAQKLRAPETARLAYEMAVAICEADEPPNSAERWFLDELRRGLALDPAVANAVQHDADEVSAIALPAAIAPVADAVASSASATELDQLVLNNAILAGALELLPNTLATMAIVPVQMRLVYQVGKAHGYELDRGHIKDLLATVGVGLASQVVENYAERAVRGLLGKFVGGLLTGMAGQLTSSGVSFATTYALGQLARQYYGGGRRFSAIELRSLYDSLMGQGRSLQSRYGAQIREQAGRVNLGNLTSMLRGNG
jgi:uncharacterized protein (DUF697 family)/tellurite resistance protein